MDLEKSGEDSVGWNVDGGGDINEARKIAMLMIIHRPLVLKSVQFSKICSVIEFVRFSNVFRFECFEFLNVFGV